MVSNPFEFFTYPNDTAFPPDPDQNSNFVRIISGVIEDVAAGVNQIGPDGWQAQWADGGAFQQCEMTRLPINSTAFRYKMRLSTTDRGGVAMPLEFRVPAHKFRLQDAVSFAVDVDANVRNTCQISIRMYKRVSGTLTISDEVFSRFVEAGAQRLVVSSATQNVLVDADVIAIGFVIYHQQLTTNDSIIVLTDPMAAMGDFPSVLPFSPAMNPLDEMAHYVSVHRLQQRGYTGEASDVGIMVPMPFKHRDLGTLRAERVTLSGEQNSSNVTGITTEISDKGSDLAVLAQTVNAGAFRIDSRVVADVLYEKVV